MSQKRFNNDLVAIRKRKVTLTLSKSTYVGMCVINWSKVLMYKLHYGYVKINMVISQDYYSLILIVLCMKLKP